MATQTNLCSACTVGGATLRHRLWHEIRRGAAKWGSQRVAPGKAAEIFGRGWDVQPSAGMAV
eukprot:71395-Chlamydomonas_euryale.AAC.1